MQSYRFTKSGDLASLTLSEHEIPEPGHAQVLLRVQASSLNYRDLALVRGEYPGQSQADFIPLSDAAAEVLACGSGCTRFKVGDRVISSFFPQWSGGRFEAAYRLLQYGSHQDGWLCQYKCVAEHDLVSLPQHLSFAQGATLPCAALTAWSALSEGRPLQPGQQILILGSGGVALFALQFAKLWGARVIALTSSQQKIDKLYELGADHVINYHQQAEWGKQVHEHSQGGVDKVIETGGVGTLAQSLKAVKVGAEIALIGFLAQARHEFDAMQIMLSGADIRRVSVGSRQALTAMCQAMQMHHLQPIIAREFTWQEVPDAWDYFATCQHFGKVVMHHSL